eukprot:1829662-Prymnesium_polylepis.1
MRHPRTQHRKAHQDHLPRAHVGETTAHRLLDDAHHRPGELFPHSAGQRRREHHLGVPKRLGKGRLDCSRSRSRSMERVVCARLRGEAWPLGQQGEDLRLNLLLLRHKQRQGARGERFRKHLLLLLWRSRRRRLAAAGEIALDALSGGLDLLRHLRRPLLADLPREQLAQPRGESA